MWQSLPMAQPESDDPGLPLKLEPCSNGEYVPSPATSIVRRTIEETHRVADLRSRRLGISRRQFLQSSAGMTTPDPKTPLPTHR